MVSNYSIRSPLQISASKTHFRTLDGHSIHPPLQQSDPIWIRFSNRKRTSLPELWVLLRCRAMRFLTMLFSRMLSGETYERQHSTK